MNPVWNWCSLPPIPKKIKALTVKCSLASSQSVAVRRLAIVGMLAILDVASAAEFPFVHNSPIYDDLTTALSLITIKHVLLAHHGPTKVNKDLLLLYY